MKYDCRYCAQQMKQVYALGKQVRVIDSQPSYRNIANGSILPRKTGIKNAPYQGGGGCWIITESLLKSLPSMI